MNFDERALAFACGTDRLYGVLTLPAQPAARGVLVVVGGPQYRAGSHRQFILLARALATQGIAVMRFDYRGMGDSEGAARDFSDIDDDLRAAIDGFIGAVPGLQEIVLWGLCDGAAAALCYAPQDARVCGLVLLNPWVRTEQGAARAWLKHYYLQRLGDAGFWKKLAGGGFDVRGAARSLWQTLGAALGKGRSAAPQTADATADGPQHLPDQMLACLRRFQGRILLILSGNDLTAREFCDLLARSGAWRQALQGRHVQRHDLADADHTFSQQAWRDQVAQWTGAWLQEE